MVLNIEYKIYICDINNKFKYTL